MPVYKLVWQKPVRKDFRSIPKSQHESILQKAEGLNQNPRPPQSKKLSGCLKNAYRLRVGNYRVVYTIDDKEKIVTIYAVRDRKDAYRN